MQKKFRTIVDNVHLCAHGPGHKYQIHLILVAMPVELPLLILCRFKKRHRVLYFIELTFLYVGFVMSQCIAASVTVEYGDDQNLKSIAAVIEKESLSNIRKHDGNLVVTLGPLAFASEVQKPGTNNLVALYISSREFRRIVDDHPDTHRKNISAVFTDIDPRLHIRLAGLLAPSAKKLIVITDLTPRSVFSEMASTLKENGATLSVLKRGDTPSLVRQMDANQVLIAFEDSSLFTEKSIRPIIASLYRRKKFMVGHSVEQTTAGALAAIFPSKDLYLRQVINALNDCSKQQCSLGLAYASEFQITINQVLAKAIGYYSSDIDVSRLVLKLKGTNDNG